ncbi:MAG: Zn-ribbon domain-containing OB-fold protein [Rhodospirillales bacterium]|nr:Zn-ribbon domain-containing OB-fold protein [Rhodospirillales bacterium]
MATKVGTETPNTRLHSVPVAPGLFPFPVPPGERPRLLANRCRTCSTTYFPRREICPNCFGRAVWEDSELSDSGTIYASTIVHVPSPAGIEPPYAYGYVDMRDGTNDDQSVRVFAHFTSSDHKNLAVGKHVELTLIELRRDDQGRPVISYAFQPVGE